MNALDMIQWGYSLGRAEDALRNGSLSERQFLRFVRAWGNGAARYTSPWEQRQERLYTRGGGYAALAARFARVKRAIRNAQAARVEVPHA